MEWSWQALAGFGGLLAGNLGMCLVCNHRVLNTLGILHNAIRLLEINGCMCMCATVGDETAQRLNKGIMLTTFPLLCW